MKPKPEAEKIPRYRCHKTVRALPIESITLRGDDGVAEIISDDPILPHRIITGPGWIDRFPGGRDKGYYVLYEDGYESWSPTEAFENGYERIG